jgi:malonyl-CoA/methylmalonyl-CoA synthetase
MHLISRASQYKGGVAIVSEGKPYTYDTLLNQSKLAGLHLLGKKSDLQGARVAFMVNPGFDYVKIQWGIWQAGGIAVPLNPGTPFPSIKYILEDAGVTSIVVTPEYLKLFKPYTDKTKTRLISTEIPDNPIISLPDIDPERDAMILYTSGTTGSPKGVVTTHANIQAQIESLVEAWHWSERDHILNVLPLHHVHGIINILSCALWSGATCEFLPKFNAEEVFEAFKRGEVNLFMAVPTIYYKLIAQWERQSVAEQKNISDSLSKMRLMVSGSAALPVSVMVKWQEISGHRLLERYGMTEIGMAISNPYKGVRKAGCIGLPLPGVEVRLVNEQDEPVIEDESGEIQVKGPNVFSAYWNKPEATKESFTDDGWFRTGDIAIYDWDSYKILGRMSVDIIKTGGYKISALEIEEVLRTHPQIKDCGVVGIPDDEWGEIVATGLVPESDEEPPDPDRLRDWIGEKLPGYKTPRKYLILEDLPRNAMGKVTKNELKKLF